MQEHRKRKHKLTTDEQGYLLLTDDQISSRYGLTKVMMDRYLPRPVVGYRRNNHWKYVRKWREEDVLRALENPELKNDLEQRRKTIEEQRKRAKEEQDIRNLLTAYNPQTMIEKGRTLRRVFVLHVGPTNSGKTYDAVRALKESGCGTYLGPLRLLALEMFDKINGEGIPCSLLTGEESIPTENAQIVSSTIELCDYRRHFKVAVIDEAQLISDSDRGSAWFKAICQVDAEEVHICLAPEAREYIESLVCQFGDPYSVVEHERLVPLVYAGTCTFEEIRPYDALICFSRKNVLSTAAMLENRGFRASVIYGALPPAARRNEVERYVSGETNVIVATDAIGMGISLPIRRIVFTEVTKFDGHAQRNLHSSEVRQIAGRAGRYGMFDRGEVLTLAEDSQAEIIEKGLERVTAQIRKPCIAFPREVLDTQYPLMKLLQCWERLPASREFEREKMTEAMELLRMLEDQIEGKDRQLVYDLVTCPVDSKQTDVKYYWLRCAKAILHKRRVPLPYFDTETLEGCEMMYKALDVHHQLMLRIGKPDKCSDLREEVCAKIKELMEQDKSGYIRRCRICRKELPIGFSFQYCQECFEIFMN